MIRFYLDYINQWVFVVAVFLPAMVFAGWGGLTLARRILSAGDKDDTLFWLAAILLMSGFAARRVL